jgi:hypothetical protein
MKVYRRAPILSRMVTIHVQFIYRLWFSQCPPGRMAVSPAGKSEVTSVIGNMLKGDLHYRVTSNIMVKGALRTWT